MSAPTVYGKAPPISYQLAERWRRTPPARIYRFVVMPLGGGLKPLPSLDLVHRGTGPYDSHTRQIVEKRSAVETRDFLRTQILRVVDQGYKEEVVKEAVRELLLKSNTNNLDACLLAQDAIRTRNIIILKVVELENKVKEH